MVHYGCAKLPYKKVLVLLLAVVLFVATLFLAHYIAEHESAQTFVSKLGYMGVLLIAFISGISVVSPIPPATFVPIFTAAGLMTPIIIATLVIGTTLADLAGYFFGTWGRTLVTEHYPDVYTRIQRIDLTNYAALAGFVFLYAAFMPFPNEAFLIPLALLGVRLRRFITPLVLGTTIYHVAVAYGAESVYQLLF